MRFTWAEVAEDVSKMLWSKETWLLDHGSKKPAHEVEIQRRHAAVLRQVLDGAERAAQRDREQRA